MIDIDIDIESTMFKILNDEFVKEINNAMVTAIITSMDFYDENIIIKRIYGNEYHQSHK